MSKTKTWSKQETIGKMFDRIAHRYDFLNALLSMRQDRRWRRHLVSRIPKVHHGRFVDVATGTGDVLLATTKARPEYESYQGLDISREMLFLAKDKADAKLSTEQRQKVNLSVCGAQALTPLADESIDCLTISFGLRNVVERQKALAEFRRVLKRGGSLLILEFFPPEKGLWSRLFGFYFHHVLPQVGGLFSDKEAYQYLPTSVEGFVNFNNLCDELFSSGIQLRYQRNYLFGSCKLGHFVKR